MPKTSAMLVELPMVTMLPPLSTNFLSWGMVLSSEIRPSILWYSAGVVAGSGGAPKTAPPPPPRAPPASRREAAPDGAIGEDDGIELTFQIARVERRGIDNFEGKLVLLEQP